MGQTPIVNLNALFDNVQGDILGDGFLKQVEFFDFFQILQPGDFRKKLAQVVPLIASARAQQAERARVANEVAKIRAAADAASQDARDISVPSKQANIAFTFTGLQKLQNAGSSADTRAFLGPDSSFSRGMQSDALGFIQDPPSSNPGVPNWHGAFLDRQIDGVLLIAANDDAQATQLRNQIFGIFGSSIKEILKVPGSARTGQLRRHEHFGFLDGVSEPGLDGIDPPVNGQLDRKLINPGIVLCNRKGDITNGRPDWQTDGSFLVFRWLEQKVPEFKNDWGKFATQLGMQDTPANRELIGARIIGRWQSGALITEFPNADPLPLSESANKTRDQINAIANVNDKVDFTSGPGCPLGAHIRKMNPRQKDLDDSDLHRIVRRGIQFGPEVTPSENQNNKTDPNAQRGLLFACYQSNIRMGYAFIQQFWANNESFPDTGAGVDPILGQANRTGTSAMEGMNPADKKATIKIPFVNPYIIPHGGEYFFSPSMTTLKSVLADNATPPPPPPPPPSSTDVQCYIENRGTGHRSSARVPVDGVSRPISQLWGNDATGDYMGLNQWAADNVDITVTSADGRQSARLPGSQTPVLVSSPAADLSKFVIVGRVRN